jgi:hypothetical protein
MELLGTLFDAITRMSKLNQGLLLLSKIDNNQFSQQAEIEISIVADRLLVHLGEFIEHGGITITKDYKYPLRFRMDPALADILLNNLLTNAIRHNIPGGTITIITDQHCLEIRNTGLPPGVDTEELFERFRKGSSRRRRHLLTSQPIRCIIHQANMRRAEANRHQLQLRHKKRRQNPRPRPQRNNGVLTLLQGLKRRAACYKAAFFLCRCARNESLMFSQSGSCKIFPYQILFSLILI